MRSTQALCLYPTSLHRHLLVRAGLHTSRLGWSSDTLLRSECALSFVFVLSVRIVLDMFSRRRQQDGRNMHTPTLNSLEFMGAIPPGVGRRWNVLHEAVPLTSAQKKLSARGLRSGRSSTFQTYERLKERLLVSLA